MKTICFDCQKVFMGKEIINTCPQCCGPLIGDKKMNEYLKNLPDKYGLQINDYFYKTTIKKLSNNLRVKFEGSHPSGSFKDRGTVYEILFAKDNGYEEVICASTGNMAVSVGYFCQKLGVKCTILIPSSTPQNRIETLKKYNTNLELMNENYDVCAKIAKERSEQKEKTLLVGDYFIRRFGQQSCGEEIALQKKKFDYIFCPVGNGTFFNGVVGGFIESGERKTKFVAVQGEGCDPLYQAWKKGKKRQPTNNPQTIGAYFKVGNPGEGNIVMNYVYKNKYLVDSVSDNQMKKAKIDLQEKFSISTNFTSASVFASFQELLRQGKISEANKVLLILTGK